MKSYKPTMSHNVCYCKVTRFAEVDIFAWTVSEGMLVYDSDLELFGIVECVFTNSRGASLPPVVYVRYRSKSGKFFSAQYTPDWASKILFVVDHDCYVMCRNGYLVYGSHCLDSRLSDVVDCCVTKIDAKHNQVFIRPLSSPNFGYWVSAFDVVCNYRIGVNKNEKENHN